jgi:Mg2+ and Co2+ transporter CorA
MVNRHQIEVKDAVDKTLQRNEEYLKRLLPVLEELKSTRNKIQSLREEGEIANFQKEIVDRLASISEDIEGVLRILNVIERE